MRIRTTVILCVVAIAGVLAAIWCESRWSSGAETGHATTRVLLADSSLTEQSIDRVTLTKAGGVPLVFVRDEATWSQVQPFEYGMDAYSITQIVRQALTLEALDLDTSELAPQGLGLRPPRATLLLAGLSGSVELKLGRRGVGGRAYVQLADDSTIRVVGDDLHDRALDMDPKEWRDRTLFPGVGFDSERVDIASGADVVSLVRDRKRWTMTAPVKTRVSGPARDELLQALGRAQAGGFIVDEPDDLGRFGLAEPTGSITVVTPRVRAVGGEATRTTETKRLIIGARTGVGTQDRFGMIEGVPVVLRIPTAVVQAFFRPATALIDGTASGVVAADVKSILVRGPEGEFRLERNLDQWLAPEFSGRTVSTDGCQQLLDTLTKVQATSIDLRPYPRASEVATITLYGFDAMPMDTVRVARLDATATADAAWILENGDNVLRIHPASIVLPLTPTAFDLAAAEQVGYGRGGS